MRTAPPRWNEHRSGTVADSNVYRLIRGISIIARIERPFYDFQPQPALRPVQSRLDNLHVLRFLFNANPLEAFLLGCDERRAAACEWVEYRPAGWRDEAHEVAHQLDRFDGHVGWLLRRAARATPSTASNGLPDSGFSLPQSSQTLVMDDAGDMAGSASTVERPAFLREVPPLPVERPIEGADGAPLPPLAVEELAP